MLTPEQYAEICSRLATYDKWAEQFRMRNGFRVVPVGATPPAEVTNDERSAVEVFEFCRDKPDRYFLYVKAIPGLVTTWTGQTLGTCQLGSVYRGGFGDKRQPITVRAVNGCTYHGTYFKSAGDYARITKSKHQTKAA